MLLYLSIHYLHWEESIFWECTPRKFLALISAALEIEQAKGNGKKGQKSPTAQRASNTPGSLDDLPGW